MNQVITFGCRLNFYESELIKQVLHKTGHRDTIVINSCAVTNEAERQVKQTIRSLHRRYPAKKIIVVGCAVQLNSTVYKNLPGVVKVLGNQDKLLPDNYRNACDEVVTDIKHIAAIDHGLVSGFHNKARAFIEIQNGCDHKCTFCAIKDARGSNRSLSIEKIIAQVEILVIQGYKEIVFTGVDITDFGKSLPNQPSLAQLIKAVFRTIPQLRLRLSSLDVAEIDAELFALIAHEKRLMPHLHLSIQSGDNMILKRMRRRHNREQIIAFCTRIKQQRPEIVFGADIIAGFPTETEEMFQNTYDLVREVELTWLHVFPFSPKDNTPAARMPQVLSTTRKIRAKKLRDIGIRMVSKLYHTQLHTIQNIIVEKNEYGRAENFALVKFTNTKNVQLGDLVKVYIYDATMQYLLGRLL